MRRYLILAFLLVTADARAVQDTRLFDVSQPPYNAVGDGATDCSQAFQNALHDAGEGNEGGVVFVPRGQFLISEPLRMRPNTALRGVWTHPPNSPQF
jgi:polygalacturonase